jgi:gamma-glutamyltranspeptidase/glutathione hydrolase
MQARAYARSSISSLHPVSDVAVATTSQLAADAARELAAAGGNAVDCALAAALITMNTEPGVCALAGSAFVTVWADGAEPCTIDGNVAVPGAGLAAEERGLGTVAVSMDYGAGVETLVGPGSVSVPGTLAAIELAWKKYGTASWRELFAPAIRAARDGFPLPAACHYYLGYSGDCIFARSDDGYRAIHHDDGRLRDAGSTIVVPHLADTLDAVSRDGARLFYEGELGAAISEHCRDGGGMLTRQDLETYRALERPPLMAEIGGWAIATNPPPAIGGAVLAAMLFACSGLRDRNWNQRSLQHLIRSQRACLDYRARALDLADDIDAAAARLIALARSGRLLSRWTSASTVHTSVVDDTGTGCAITASSGYGSGEMPAGTGLWLNNCLGEIELNRRGLDAGPVGSRLPSNMAPSVARRDDSVLAAGSPGADRITTAMQQFLINFLLFDMQLDAAIAHPRVHVDTSGDTVRLMAEPGLDLPETDLPLTVFADLGMYFGGIGAAIFDKTTGLASAADPRREGGTCVYEHF